MTPVNLHEKAAVTASLTVNKRLNKGGGWRLKVRNKSVNTRRRFCSLREAPTCLQTLQNLESDGLTKHWGLASS